MRHKGLDPLEHDWEINPRLYRGIRNVDYSGMTDLVEVIVWRIGDNEMRRTEEAGE